MKKPIFFILAVCISLLGATYNWGDSAHSIGLIKAGGGEVKHPSTLESGKRKYMLISTATVIPPYRGDVRVALEGQPEMDYRIYASAPIINLGLRRMPELKDNVFYDLSPKDRIALWVEMKPPVDPVNRRYTLAFYDTKTNKSVLNVPIIFKGKGGMGNANQHQH